MGLKKTINDYVYDSQIRAQNENMDITQIDDNNYYVINNKYNSYYILSVDNDNRRVCDCSCPHYVHRLESLQVPCKHIINLCDYLGYEYY